MIDARWIKQKVKRGEIVPVEGVSTFNPRWSEPRERTPWRGIFGRFGIEFYPAGRVIDMSTVRVFSVHKNEATDG